MKFLFNNNDVYKTRYFLYRYNDRNLRIVKLKNSRCSGFEETTKKTNDFIDVNSEESKRCSISRTKRNIRELALCNSFEYFCTFTVNSLMCDRYSLNDVQDKLKKVLHKIKRNNKEFAYLIITEKHKDGAFHFHGLIKGINDLYINDNNYLSNKIFDNELGFNSFSPIKDYTKCCNYITKYITKDCIKNSHNQIYISSRGLKKADKQEFNNIDFKPSFENDFCEILDIDIEKLTQEEKIDLFYKLQKENEKKCRIIN